MVIYVLLFSFHSLTTNNTCQEAQILSDKYMLEKRITYMRMVSVCVFSGNAWQNVHCDKSCQQLE
jgi:hypothetical protein